MSRACWHRGPLRRGAGGGQAKEAQEKEKRLRVELDDSKGVLEGLKGEKAALTAQISSLNKQLAAVSGDRDSVQALAAEAEGAKKELERLREEQGSELTALKEETRGLLEEVKGLRSDKAEMLRKAESRCVGVGGDAGCCTAWRVVLRHILRCPSALLLARRCRLPWHRCVLRPS